MPPLYYIYKYPYKIFWHLINFIGKTKKIVFYCADPLDYEMFLPIKKHLPPVSIIAKNKKTREYLNSKGIEYLRMPVFPQTVIMARHSPYKFPVKNIAKVGFDHGLYQFKRWTSPKYYNGFDIYFVSSSEQVKTAKQLGIKTTKAIGYPKLDNAFNGTYNDAYLNNLKDKINLDPKKKTIIFTSTWDVDCLSALQRWIDKVASLTEKYNILITVHTWTSPQYIKKLKSIEGAIYLNEFDVTPYLMIADIFVGDFNSMIGEFCALDKPIITFKVPESKRAIPEVREMIKRISLQIDDFDEIHAAIEQSLINPNERSLERKKANEIIFYKLDGNAGKRAAEEIKNLLERRD